MLQMLQGYGSLTILSSDPYKAEQSFIFLQNYIY